MNIGVPQSTEHGLQKVRASRASINARLPSLERARACCLTDVHPCVPVCESAGTGTGCNLFPVNVGYSGRAC